MGSLMDFTLSNARRFYSLTWKVLGFSGVMIFCYVVGMKFFHLEQFLFRDFSSI